MRFPIAAISFLALGAVACAGVERAPTSAAAESVTISLSARDPMTSAGDTRVAVATVLDANRAEKPSPTVEWSSSAPGVARVVADGVSATITAVEDGTATITARSGSARDTIVVTVHRTLAEAEITSPTAVIPPGGTVQLAITAFDARHHALTHLAGVAWRSTNTGQLVVTNTGLVTGVFARATRSATIIATVSQDGIAASASVLLAVAVEPTFDFAALLLTGSEQPAPVAGAGVGAAFFTLRGDHIDYLVAWSALTGPATSVHLHGPGAFNQLSGILLDLSPSAQSANYGTASGSISAADIKAPGAQPPMSVDSLVALMRAAAVYVDVHSGANPDGEIRGQMLHPL